MKTLAVQKPSGYDLAYGLAVYRDDDEFNERLSEVMKLNVMELATPTVVAIDANASIEDVCRILDVYKRQPSARLSPPSCRASW